MDPSRAVRWEPPWQWRRITVVDSHAGGEPFRVVVEGTPEIPGATMSERRAYAAEHEDELRRLLMWEPRGHADMYGALIGPPVEPESDISVLFMHNDGFSTMCGHGVIALTKVVLDTGILHRSEPETTLRIDTPAGRVVSTATVVDGIVERVRFRNVPSFVVELDNIVDVEGIGPVHYDLAFGGAFYAFVDVDEVGLTCTPYDFGGLIEEGREIKQAVMRSRALEHPVDESLAFLYGVIFIGPPQDRAHHSRNVCVFADGEIDRSPTGTGVSARLAIHHARGDLRIGDTITVESIIGSTFSGRAAETTEYGGMKAIVPEIEGTAHVSGRSEFWVDPDDSLSGGFFLR